MSKYIEVSHFDVYVSKIGYGTYAWTLVTTGPILRVVDHNARNFDEFNDGKNLPAEYFEQIKRDLAEYIAAENNCIITFIK